MIKLANLLKEVKIIKEKYFLTDKAKVLYSEWETFMRLAKKFDLYESINDGLEHFETYFDSPIGDNIGSVLSIISLVEELLRDNPNNSFNRADIENSESYSESDIEDLINNGFITNIKP